MPKQSLGYWLRLSFAIDTVLDFIYDHLSQTTSGPESDPQRGVVNSHDLRPIACHLCSVKYAT